MRSKTVHNSWRVAQQATETRKESYVVMAQRSPGRGQEGEISPGGIDGIFERSNWRYQHMFLSLVGNRITDMQK